MKYEDTQDKKICLKCSGQSRLSNFNRRITIKPVLMIKRVNTKTNDWFWGCSNFPKCKNSENRPSTEREKASKVNSWANAQCGPHY